MLPGILGRRQKRSIGGHTDDHRERTNPSPAISMRFRSQLPRLQPESYRGQVYVFWTYTIEQRASGWLDRGRHVDFREVHLHTLARFRLSCPVYVLMPDHLHFIWIGAHERSDQPLASTFIRKLLNQLLRPHRLQRQPHDHVLREEERRADRFADTVGYIRRNPERAGLVEAAADRAYQGATIPGYPNLGFGTEAYWETFWKCHNAYQASLLDESSD